MERIACFLHIVHVVQPHLPHNIWLIVFSVAARFQRVRQQVKLHCVCVCVRVRARQCKLYKGLAKLFFYQLLTVTPFFVPVSLLLINEKAL